MKINNRLKKLRRLLSEREIDSILISQPENRRYLSGFVGTAGYLFITERKAILATDFRYIEQAGTQAPDYEIVQITNDMSTWFPRLIDGLNTRRLGFEAGHITFSTYRRLADIIKEKKLSLELNPLDGLVESLRAVKEPDFESVIQPGMTEKEAAWEIEQSLRNNGSQSIPFDIIVASGPNAALPHARPSMRVINPGEPVVVDMGARFEGYASDLSRTICPGAPDGTFKKIYDVVLDAQLSAVSIIKEGMTGEQADSAARNIIAQAGYGEAFGHSLGHGIGLAPHEVPRLGPGSTDILISGMIFTIEPGIYLPGWGGIRIEDTVIMENGKVKVISKARKE